MRYLIRQAKLIPFLFLIPITIAGLLTENYDMIKQHGSEITLTDFATAKAFLNFGAISAGISCILLALGVFLNFKRYHLSSVLLIIFGISMISNGLYPMGSPMHGLYGIGLSFMLLPFVACYELKNELISNRFFPISVFAGVVVFIYFWAMLVGLDPANYRGLTQRIACVFIFGWIAYFGFELNRKLEYYQ
ncbi:MAG: DUF998 domain-containing protein [Bacteroidota bacterium]